MSLDAIELLSEADRQALADRLALELLRPVPPAFKRRPGRQDLFDYDRTRVILHGITWYRLGKCRCDTCVQAWMSYKAVQRPRKHATPTIIDVTPIAATSTPSPQQWIPADPHDRVRARAFEGMFDDEF